MAEQQGLPAEKVVEESSELKAARVELAEQKAEATKLRFEANNKQIELNKLREQQQRQVQQDQQAQQAQQYQEPQDEQAQFRAWQQQQQQMTQNLSDEMGLMKFRMRNPDANETELLEIINDSSSPVNAIYKPNSNIVDYDQTFAMAKYYQDSQKLKTVETKTAEVREAEKPSREQQIRLATISGSTSVEDEPVVDVSNMTAQEMYDQGLVEKNPDDPVRFDK